MNKEMLKEKFLEFKPAIIVCTCLVISFISGYIAGAGATKDITELQTHYNTNSDPGPQSLSTSTTTNSLDVECPVKGNISNKGVRTYHVSGGAFYQRTIAEECFNTEAEAQSKGYNKSSR